MSLRAARDEARGVSLQALELRNRCADAADAGAHSVTALHPCSFESLKRRRARTQPCACCVVHSATCRVIVCAAAPAL